MRLIKLFENFGKSNDLRDIFDDISDNFDLEVIIIENYELIASVDDQELYGYEHDESFHWYNESGDVSSGLVGHNQKIKRTEFYEIQIRGNMKYVISNWFDIYESIKKLIMKSIDMLDLEIQYNKCELFKNGIMFDFVDVLEINWLGSFLDLSGQIAFPNRNLEWYENSDLCIYLKDIN